MYISDLEVRNRAWPLKSMLPGLREAHSKHKLMVICIIFSLFGGEKHHFSPMAILIKGLFLK